MKITDLPRFQSYLTTLAKGADTFNVTVLSASATQLNIKADDVISIDLTIDALDISVSKGAVVAINPISGEITLVTAGEAKAKTKEKVERGSNSRAPSPADVVDSKAMQNTGRRSHRDL